MVLFKHKIKHSFSKVKEDINSLDNELKHQRNIILRQNNLLLDLIRTIKEDQNKVFFNNSIGNKGVKQSINHLSTKQLSTKREDLEPKKAEFEDIQEITVPVIKHTLSTFQAQKLELSLKNAENNLNFIFSKLTKQELKAFLTIYQLEDEGINVTYFHISNHMKLSESCTRAYISSLLKKGCPIIKKKVNNKLTLIFVKKEFKTLNLKEKLISLYYEDDPLQKKLIDII